MKIDNLALRLLSGESLLIAGTSGAGKSVAENNLIATLAATRGPAEASVVLLDPKKVELWPWQGLPHRWLYADTLPEIIQALNQCRAEMDRRYRIMRAQGLRRWNGQETYIFCDEIMDLILTTRGIVPALSGFLSVCRAAGFRLILCTQSPARAVLPAAIQVNIQSRLGLRCATAEESRQAIGIPGAELLPRYGEAYLRTSEGLERVKINMITGDEQRQIIDYWAARVRPEGKAKKWK